MCAMLEELGDNPVLYVYIHTHILYVIYGILIKLVWYAGGIEETTLPSGAAGPTRVIR